MQNYMGIMHLWREDIQVRQSKISQGKRLTFVFILRAYSIEIPKEASHSYTQSRWIFLVDHPLNPSQFLHIFSTFYRIF